MNDITSSGQVDYDEPILFRTSNPDVCRAALENGSLWLRSDRYYRSIEDAARRDHHEGINSARTIVPVRLVTPNGIALNISGEGQIGQQVVPHYIFSMHGPSISEDQLLSFGGCTFGIRSITKLSAEILYRSSQVLKCNGYRYGSVNYQYSALAQSLHQKGSSAIALGGSPPVFLNPLNTDVLRKTPIAPFISQDEWRIVIFTEAYLDNDPDAPLRINVSPTQFYPCSRNGYAADA